MRDNTGSKIIRLREENFEDYFCGLEVDNFLDKSETHKP